MNTVNVGTVEAVLLDIDGTIADTDDATVARVARWLRRVPWARSNDDVQVSARRFVMRLETPINRVVSWLDRTGLDQILGPILDRLHRLRGISAKAHARLIPGVEEALVRLAGQYPLGIVTAREHTSAHAILHAHAIDNLFQCVATARTCRRAKPNPDPVLWAADQLGVAPEHCLMVGDTTADILAGNAAGVQTVGVLCGFGDRRELEAAGAEMILNTTAELAPLLLD